MEDFVIPVSVAELTTRTSVNQYVVHEVVSIRDLKTEVRKGGRALIQGSYLTILDTFDIFYSVLHQWSETPPAVKEESWETILKGCQDAVTGLCDLLESNFDKDVQSEHRNALKMNLYLLCNFIEQLESDLNQTENPFGRKGRGKKKARNIVSDYKFHWPEECETALQTLEQLIKLQLQNLWDPPIVEEDFVNMVANVCYKVLENADLAQSLPHRRVIARVLATLVRRYGDSVSFTLKLTQLLSYFPDHMPETLMGLIHVFVEEENLSPFVKSMLVEICNCSGQDLERDSACARSFTTFLNELAATHPTLAQAALPMLKVKLDEDPYSMRNCVLNVIGEIIVRIYANNEQLDAQHRNQRDKLFDILEEHIHDVNGFVRSKTLNVWMNIVDKGALPVRRQSQLVDLLVGSTGAILDTASSSRRYAIKILTSMVQHSPAAKLTHSELKESFEKEQNILIEMEKSRDPDNDWKDCLEGIQEALRNNALVGDLDVQIGENDSPEVVAGRISQALRAKETDMTRKAVQLFSLAQEHFPDNALFCDVSERSSDNEDEREEEEEEQYESEKVKRKLICWISKLHDIFLYGLQPANSQGGANSQSDYHTDYLRQKGVVEYLRETMTFADQIQRALPDVSSMLSSKTASDVMEAIDFFVTGYLADVPNMIDGVRKMLILVWSNDQSVREAMVKAYKKLYIEKSAAESDSDRACAIKVVTNLGKLVVNASLGEMLSLEKLICELMKRGDVDRQMLNVMWEKFTRKLPNTTSEEAKTAIILLGFAAVHSSEIIKSNVDLLINVGLANSEGEIGDLEFIEYVCKALQRMAAAPKSEAGAKPPEPFRFEHTHVMFRHLANIVIRGMDSPDLHYIPMMEQAISTIYSLAENPDKITTEVIRRCASQLLANKENEMEVEPEVIDEPQGEEEAREKTASGDEENQAQNPSCPGEKFLTCSARLLSRFIAICGHVAMKQLVHLDVSILNELKRRTAIKEEKEERQGSRKSRSKRSDVRRDENAGPSVEEEMGLTGATADDAEAEFIRRLCDSHLVTDRENYLLAAAAPLVVHICAQQHRYQNSCLQAAATLALTKFMLVSSDFCDQNLQLLFTLAEKSQSEVIRANLIVALGDLAKRFPNLVEPWTPNLYARLRDTSPKVRVNALNTMSHLILNDMVKVKGQISEMATCIVDQQDRIVCLVKLFFSELAKKGNALYNIMPDIISRLSDAEMNEDNFHIIMEYLFPFIQKEKQKESMVEKLCLRFRATQKSRHWRDLAFCLSLMTFNDKMLAKLQENFHCFIDKLHIEDVYAAFSSILTNAKKNAKAESASVIEEMETKIEEFHQKGVADEEALEKAKKAAHAARNRRRRTRRRVGTDEDSTSTPGTQGPGPSQLRSTARKQPKRTRAAAARAMVFSSDDSN